MSFASIPMRLRPSCPLVPTFRSLSLGTSLQNAAKPSLGTSPQNAAKPQTVIPKKPSSPWIRYYVANFPQVKAALPNAKNPEIMKQISSKWKLLGENQKNQYVTAYEKEREIYKLKVSKIPEGVLAEASQEIAKKRTAKLKKMAHSELTELLSSLQKPSRPIGSYLMYVSARRLQVKPTGRDAVAVIAKEWNALTDQQKLPYARKAEASSEQYKKDLVTWTNKMNTMGRETGDHHGGGEEAGPSQDKIEAD